MEYIKSITLCANDHLLEYVNSIILLCTLIFISWQTYLLRQSNYATAYKVARDILQDQDIRDARKHVFTVLRSKPYQRWNKKDKSQAEKVCQSYDSVGQMVRKKMLPEAYIVDNWLVGLKDGWELLKPLVLQYRNERDYLKNWDDFEYLAKKAISLYGKQS